MNKHEFYNKVAEGIKEKLGEDFAVDVREVMKVNITLDGLTILHKSENISPTIYLNSYKEHFDSGRPLEDIIEDILSVYELNRNPENIAVEQFYDFDKLKDKIIVKVIGTDKNERFLEDVPHILMGDLGLAAIPYVMLKTEPNASMGFQVQHNHLKLWNKSLSDIMPIAAKNTNRMYRFVVKSMTEVLFTLLNSGELFEEDELEAAFEDVPMYVLTASENKTLGASQLYLKDKIKEFADRCECNLYILPSSIHELILLREDFTGRNVEELKEMVREVNATEVSEQDFLSDNVYFYDRETDEIKKL